MKSNVSQAISHCLRPNHEFHCKAALTEIMQLLLEKV